MSQEKNYRDRIYQSYNTARNKPLTSITIEGLKSRLPYFNSMIRHHFPQKYDAEILDLGCGHGALLYALQAHGYRNTRGVDVSSEQVEAAKGLGIEKVLQGDVMETLAATADESLDVVVAFDLIEHFYKEELIGLIDEVRRVLKPSGRWIIHVPNAEGPFGSRIRYSDFTHELAFTRISMTQLLMASGFSEVTCFEDRPVPHGLKSTVRAIFWKVIRLNLLVFIAVETGQVDGAAIFSQNLLAVAKRGV
jgi:2-polyprenyl-3-methyl-5-hydroxy-6-metoxy-1,4-benzoquinol methylase